MKQLLRDIISAWWAEPLPAIKARAADLTRLFDPRIKKVITVTGFRRVGKTFTLLDFAQKHGQRNCIYLNFEDERLPAATPVLTSLIETIRELRGDKSTVLLLDEIQRIPDWHIWARRINQSARYRLILSGSSSRLSSQELPTQLRGHSLNLQIRPLGLSEFLGFKETEASAGDPADRSRLLREYLQYGGLPEIVLSDEGLKPLLLQEYFSTFVLRDVIERHGVRKQEALRELLRLLPGTRTYTFTKLAHTLNSLGHTTGKATLIRYLRWIEASYFLSSLEVYDPSMKQRLQAPRKAYLADTFFTSRLASPVSQNWGHLMEGACWLKLQQMRAADPDIELYYWKDYSQYEVDFVMVRRKRVQQLIQVTYASHLAMIPERESRALLRASRKLNCPNLTIVSWDVERDIPGDGQAIHVVPLWKWLLA